MKTNRCCCLIIIIFIFGVFLPRPPEEEPDMKARRYKDISITSGKIPVNTHLWLEINSNGGFYYVATGDLTHLWYSADKMDTEAKIDVDPGDAWGGDTDHRPANIVSAWHDATNTIIYFCDHSGGNVIYVWKLDYSVSESAPTITELFTIATTTTNAVDADIFLIGSDLFVWYGDDDEITVVKLLIPNWVVQDRLFPVPSFPMGKVIVVGTVAYVAIDTAPVTLFSYTNSIQTISGVQVFVGNSLPGAENLLGISYDGSNILNFILNLDADGKNYLYSYNISGDSQSQGGEMNVALQLDRNNRATIPNELEKAFGISNEIVYEIKARRGGIVQLQDVSSLSDADLIAITDNFLMNSDGDMFEWTDVTDEMFQMSYSGGCFPIIKRGSFLTVRYYEANWNEKDSIKVYDDNDVLEIWAKITKKYVDSLGQYHFDFDFYSNELARTTYSKTYSNDKTSEKLIDIIDNKMNFLYQSSSIVATAIQYDYVLKREAMFMFSTARWLENEILYAEPDCKTWSRAAASLTATGKSWTLYDGNQDVRLVDIPRMSLGVGGYFKGSLGVTRDTVRYQNNATSTKPVAATRDPIEQRTGIIEATEYRDAKLEAATEADQLATNRYNIGSASIEFVGLRVQGEGFLPEGQTIELQGTQSIIIAQDNFVILRYTRFPKQDITFMILSDNIIFPSEFTSFLDTTRQQIHAANLQSIENQSDIDSHRHDGHTLQLDGIDSDGGDFDFKSSGFINLKASGVETPYIRFWTAAGVPRMRVIGYHIMYVYSDQASIAFGCYVDINHRLYLEQQATFARLFVKDPMRMTVSSDTSDYYRFITTGNLPRLECIGGNGEIKNIVDPTDAQDVATMGWVEKRLTPEGGFAVSLTNKTGVASVKGTVIEAHAGVDNAFRVCDADSVEAFGVVYEDGIADGSECMVVIGGRCQVLLKDATASTRGNWVEVSNVAGRADATSASPIAAPTHFQELGHAIESKGADTDVLAYIILHPN